MHLSGGLFKLILSTVFWLALLTDAFNQNSLPEKNLSFRFENVPLEEVLKQISAQTAIRFSYSPDAIPVNKSISYTCTSRKLSLVLDDICKLAGIHYKLVGDHLVLTQANVPLPPPPLVKKYTISGRITDARNKEFLIGAAVYNSETGMGALTNNYGYFSLTLPEGSYTLETSFLGYSLGSKNIDLYSNQKWDISLEPVSSLVEEVVISSVNREETIFRSLSGQTSIKPSDVKQENSALGETDMLKSFDNLPGISFQGDGSSYFFVRGGGRDQNLILLDEAPLYNPSHMLGLFTPIIPDAIKTSTIYKADFPVEYGGRISSIIDVRTRDGNKEEVNVNTSLSLVSMRLSVEGPIKKESSSYFISLRRSYFGWMFKAANSAVQDFYFNDFTTKFNLRLSERDHLFITMYYGRDKYLANEQPDLTSGLEWGNSSLTLRWNHLFSPRLFSNTTIYSSKYDYFLHTNYDAQLYWNSRITGTHLQSDFNWYLNPKNQIKFGIKVGGYFFNPGNYNNADLPADKTVSELNSSEVVVFAGNEHELSPRVNLHYGLRLTSWTDIGEAYVVSYQNYQPTEITQYEKGTPYFNSIHLEPRLSISYKTGTYSSVKASYNRSLQNIHLINNSISPFNSLEVWLPSGPNIKAQRADIFNIGWLQFWPKKSVELNVDLFYKNLHNQIGYAYHAEMMLNPYIEGQIRQGSGKAYGFEVFLTKKMGRLKGHIGYSFTRSLLNLPTLNAGKTYKARQDKPLDFSCGINYALKPRWILTSNYSLSSGLMTTTPTGFYTYRGTQVPIYTEQNNSRLPNYSRFDIGSDFRLNKLENSNFEHHLIVSFYNFFANKNAAFLYFSKTVDSEGNYVIPADKLNPQEQVATHRFIFSIIPSVTYNLRF